MRLCRGGFAIISRMNEEELLSRISVEKDSSYVSLALRRAFWLVLLLGIVCAAAYFSARQMNSLRKHSSAAKAAAPQPAGEKRR